MSRIKGAQRWPTNAHLIEDAHRLGYLRDTDVVLDPTYGEGNWWTRWQPPAMIATDIDQDKSPDAPEEFTALRFDDETFDAVAFDPPYRLNGRPDPGFDLKYGTGARAGWQERHALIRAGIEECARVLKPGGALLVKCQDQVCGGRVRWQTREFSDHAEAQGTRLVDTFIMLGGRPQPEGRRQAHADHNWSTLLVFRKHPRRRKA